MAIRFLRSDFPELGNTATHMPQGLGEPNQPHETDGSRIGGDHPDEGRP